MLHMDFSALGSSYRPKASVGHGVATRSASAPGYEHLPDVTEAGRGVGSLRQTSRSNIINTDELLRRNVTFYRGRFPGALERVGP